MSDILHEVGTMREQHCTIEHEGHIYESGGSYLEVDAQGKLRGILYHHADNSIGTWHGDKKVHAHYGHAWRSNAGDIRQYVWLDWEGIHLFGIYYKSSSDIVRVRQVK